MSNHYFSSADPNKPQLGDLRSSVNGDIEIYDGNDWVTQKPQVTTVPQGWFTTGNIGSVSIGNGGGLSGMASHGFIAQGATIGVATEAPRTIAVETKHGRVTLNLDTADITFPADIGRNEAIRDFWFGFQEVYKPGNSKLESEIQSLKKELAATKASAALMKKESEKEASKRVADKIKAKYGQDKFIMIKPDDLVAFIMK